MDDIIYLELNNWFAGEDYPTDEAISKLVNSFQLDDEEYCKENKLCVKRGRIDMSANWCITAPKSWVESICPKLLTDEEYTYETVQYLNNDGNRCIHTEKYSKFIYHCTDDGFAYGRFGWQFLPYCKENIGITYCDEDGNSVVDIVDKDIKNIDWIRTLDPEQLADWFYGYWEKKTE